MSETVLRLTGITKTYPGVTALKEVSFNVSAGEVHALLGENGAGKSTLVGVAAGVITPDKGKLEIAGQIVERYSASASKEAGLAIVYQHSTILDDLTVEENLLFGLPETQRPIRRNKSKWAKEHLVAVEANVSLKAKVGTLSIAERQLIEIARALASNSKVLILDEPTESLTAKERERLFEQINRLKALGTGIVYISHRFPEIQQIADRITVLRDGDVRGTFDIRTISENDVLQLIVGRNVEHVFPVKSEKQAGHKALLDVKNLTSSKFSGVNFSVNQGEILGLAGVEGNGQRELLRALVGFDKYQGEIVVDGAANKIHSPKAAFDSKIVHLPGDRHVEGLFLPMTVRENVSVLIFNKLKKFGIVNRKAESKLSEKSVKELGIKTPNIESKIQNLSGGNQQKVLFARSLAADPKVLVADEPTRGVDVGARSEIYRLIREFADDGHSAVVLSTDAAELAGLCDRVLVISRGQVVKDLTGENLTEREITGAAITSTIIKNEESSKKLSNSRWRNFLKSDYVPSWILSALIVVLALVTSQRNSFFLSARSVNGLLALAAILIFAALGQLTVLVAGSIDLSVGPLIGLTVVVTSFFASSKHATTGIIFSLIICLAIGTAVGAANALGVRVIKLPAMISTLVIYIFLQGVALVLRPTPAGYVNPSTMKFLRMKIGFLPATFLLALALALILEFSLRRTRPGVELRAVGSSEVRAVRFGARPTKVIIIAHIISSLFAVLAGITLTGLVGIGQAGLGAEYTLTGVTAVVLGGASIFGGRGSYIGALLGAILIQEIISAIGFLGLSIAWQEWLPGLLILAGAGLFSRVNFKP
jgi:ribose transport system ATP-binding protein